MKIPVGISNRHVHLKEEESTKLFELSQGIPVYAYLLLRYHV